MIKVKNINGIPESIPKKYFGSHSDSDFFYFFESDLEANTFRDSLPKTTPKENEHTLIELLRTCNEKELIIIKDLLK